MFGFISKVAKIFELMGDAMDFSQSKATCHKNIHLERALEIINNSSFEVDKKAFRQDYLTTLHN
jgi:hypothetical protein